MRKSIRVVEEPEETYPNRVRTAAESAVSVLSSQNETEVEHERARYEDARGSGQPYIQESQ